MLHSGQHTSRRAIRASIRLAIHGTATLYVGVPIGCAVRRGRNRNTGELCQGAVATPVFGCFARQIPCALLSSRHGSLPPA
jgi:hypothetical protein